jgi:3alpha(or 20beta)-hydroxysteroid dehydrogenase
MGQLDGKVVIVTGAARGMGAAEAELIAREGGAVVVADVAAAQAETVAAGIRSAGGRAVSVFLDVTSEADWATAVQAAEELGGIHALVNNAGISYRVGLLDADLDDWNQVMAVNMTGTLLGMRAVVPVMRRQGNGSIVNVSSIAGLTAYPASAYSVSKWGVRGMTKVAALEFAPFGIRVNSVHPGIIETPMLDNAPDVMKTAFASGTPMKRMGQAHEVAAAVLFLCSDGSSYMSGAELAVDGGFTAGGAFRGVLNEIEAVNGAPLALRTDGA